MQDARLPSEHAVVELLTAQLAAQFTMYDSRSSTFPTSRPQLPSACALAAESIVHRDGSHGKDRPLLSENVAEETLAGFSPRLRPYAYLMHATHPVIAGIISNE